MEQLRAFLRFTWEGVQLRWGFPPLRHVFHTLRHTLHNTARYLSPTLANMAQRRDSTNATNDDPKRQMVHLKTKEECRLGNETIQVWTVELPSKYAEGILRAIKANVPGQESVDLQHVRRFAKPKWLPSHLIGKRDLVKEMYAVPRTWESTPPSVMQAGNNATWEWSSNPGKPRNSGRPSTLHLLVCPTKIVPLKDLHAVLLQHPPFTSSPESWAYPLEIREVTVPLLAPVNPEQAALWSDMYWPTFYRKTNPFGAHPAVIERAEEELQNPQDDNLGVLDAFALAEAVGDEGLRKGLGIGTGCVITERVDGQTEIIAVAGDARFKPTPNQVENESSTACCQGNMMGHAVMRAVGMVGRKRLRCATQSIRKTAAKAESNFAKGGLDHDEKARDAFFLDLPMSAAEEEYFKKDNLKPDGYLSLKLEVFLTHEPCIMCSMALVHSRVGRVVFKHRMPKTGGLTAEMDSNPTGPVGLGYGLCWRKELNWQFLCWEYMLPGEEGSATRRACKDSSEKYPSAESAELAENDPECADVSSLSSFASSHV